MTPEEQDAPSRVVHDDARRAGRRVYDVMLEALAAGDLDVGEGEPHPLAVIERAFPVHDPPHGNVARPVPQRRQ